jgi:hypothetical protein
MNDDQISRYAALKAVDIWESDWVSTDSAIRALPAEPVQAQIDAAVKAERERCAKVAFGFGAVDMLAEHKPFAIAAAIRKGDQP